MALTVEREEFWDRVLDKLKEKDKEEKDEKELTEEEVKRIQREIDVFFLGM